MLRKDYILWKVWIDISFFSYLLNLISLQSLLEEYFPSFKSSFLLRLVLFIIQNLLFIRKVHPLII